jgi:hypothetical protein
MARNGNRYFVVSLAAVSGVLHVTSYSDTGLNVPDLNSYKLIIHIQIRNVIWSRRLASRFIVCKSPFNDRRTDSPGPPDLTYFMWTKYVQSSSISV